MADQEARAVLNRPALFLLDGAMATELEQMGAELKDKLWSARLLLERPEWIRAVHEAYFRAGADVAITCSYQASFEGFSAYGIPMEEGQQLFRLSVALAKEARAAFLQQGLPPGRPHPLVAASVGPYGAYLADGSEYRGQYGVPRSRLQAFHRPRIAALLSAEPDLLAFETLPDLEEAEVLLQELERFPDALAWFSFTAQQPGAISGGAQLSDVASLLSGHPQVVAIGFNCTPPTLIAPLLQELRLWAEPPFIAYPNSGEVWDSKSQCWLPGTSAQGGWLEQARAWQELGAAWIGGCCRSRPADIAALQPLRQEGNG